MRARSGLGFVSAAALIAGIAGYVVTWIVARQIGPTAYAGFAVFWSAMYFIVSSLSGIQQEVARATHPADPSAPRKVSATRDFGLFAAVAVALAVGGTAPLWVGLVFPDRGWAMVAPLAVAAASYVLVACLGGTLYGVASWRDVAVMTVADGLVRLLFLGVASVVTRDVVLLAWAAALPFPLVIALLWPAISRRVVGATRTDVGIRGLAWNVARTVAASASLGAIVGGMPLLVAVFSPEVSADRIGVAVLATTLVRAPLIVGVQALQSYLIVHFRQVETRLAPRIARICGVLVAAGAVIGVFAWWLGPAVFVLLFGEGYVVDPAFLVALVVSSVLVAAMCVLASAILSQGRHLGYGAVFVTAAIVTIGLLVLPFAFDLRVGAAAVGGPLAGLIVGVIVLALGPRRVS